MLRGFKLTTTFTQSFVNFQCRSLSDETAIPTIRKSFKKMANRPAVVDQRLRNSDLDNKAQECKKDWRIVGATILHRYPVITKDAEQWEIDMWGVQEKISDKKREWLMDQVGGSDSQLITDMNPSYQEILESMPFTPAPRTTDADMNNDRKSLDRRLQDSLFLVVKRSRHEHQWQFPQGKWIEGESIRATSERVVDRAIGKTKRYFIGNAPVGHFCYEYPKALQEKRGNFGAKVFFHRAQLISGTVKLQTKLYTDYAWIARDEVQDYFDTDTANFLKYVLPA